MAEAEGYRPSLLLYEKDKMEDTLKDFDLLVMVMATGIVVRSICPYLKDKWTDKPVVAVDSALRCAVPVVGGHHGGNDLARRLAERLQLYPAITTATDASGRPSLEGTAKALGAEILNKESSKEVNLAFLSQDVPVLRLKGPKIVVVDDDVAVLRRRGLVVGLGARRGVETEEVMEAIRSALKETGRKMEEIGVLATAWLKRDERGITEAANALGLEVLYLSPEALNAQVPTTPSRASDLGLAGVAEPAVLALAEKLIMPKKAYGRVTVALGE
ncbi:MAG TPA: cobalt-precorrin 5A hydrolase [Methanotrichaceae archaeon]|nr:cobalt-precorrin 5A hydrolase [Methanotrichaceae archaeon]